MNRLFLFNPENDIALAMGLPRITPPRQAALLHKAGAMLPFWLGDSEDAVLLDARDIKEASRWLESLDGVSGPGAVVSGGASRWAPEPWGWSLDAVSQFEKSGVTFPKREEVEIRMRRIRELSHRRTALDFLSRWEESGEMLPFHLPVETSYSAEVVEYVETFGKAMVKSPWSSSGRGVFPVSIETMDASIARIEGIMRHQGSVMVEPLLPKLQDFAMLFHYSQGKAEFAGYSLFYNSTATNYGGNYIGSDQMIIGRLEELVLQSELERVGRKTSSILTDILGNDYDGPLGVDMMICGEAGETPWIDPCVEINLRYTMGFVARGVWHKLGREGMMSVTPKIGPGLRMDVKETGDKPFRLVPDNDWFDILFHTV